MRFTCGVCGKNYKIDDLKIAEEGLSPKCRNCNNQFEISKHKALSSTSGNSKVICDNCGQFVPEKIKKCPNCNLYLTNEREELRIDNKFYETLDEEAFPQQESENISPTGKRKPKIVAFALATLLCCGTFFYIAAYTDIITPVISSPIKKLTQPEDTSIATKVIILNSGETYYVKEILTEGTTLHLKHLSGAENSISKDEVMMISDAVIEKKK